MLPTIQLPRVDTGAFAFGRTALAGVPAPPRPLPWLRALFPAYVSAPFGQHHTRFWEWLWAIEPDSDPGAFVAIWARGGAKSTSAELGAAALGLRDRRRYLLYVCSTQDRADDHVQTIGGLLEAPAVARHYPRHAAKLVGKYGNSRGWRRNRLRTNGGLTVDALGLDVAARGVKLDEMRPDFIILDDIDETHDGAARTQKKIDTITKGLLPAGSHNCAVLAIQNLIIPNGIFARLSDGRADFLARREVSGPVPALRGMKSARSYDEDSERWRDVLTAGEAAWAGQDLATCQRIVDRVGLAAFRAECQHEVHEREGALWRRAAIDASRVGQPPTMKRIVVGVDPSGGSEEIGIVVVGRGHDNHCYVLEDATALGHLGPRHWASEAARVYEQWGADRIIAEANFGGNLVEANLQALGVRLPVKLVSASRGKQVRAEPVASLYGSVDTSHADSEMHHVGTFAELETEMTSWVPGDPDSPNRLDALVWAVTELALGPSGPAVRPPTTVSYVGF